MARKIMLEVTQPVVRGNEVTVAAGELYEPGAKLPDGVTVREVIVDADDQPAAGQQTTVTEPAKPGLKPPVK